MFSARGSGNVVRRSNFRHMSGELWPKSHTHENIQLGIGQSLSEYIHSDGVHFALPYNLVGGVLAYRRLDDFGKWPSGIDSQSLDNQLIMAHQKNISDFKFSPFVNNSSSNSSSNSNYNGIIEDDKSVSRLATTSSDECVKLWRIESNKSNSTQYTKINEPESVLSDTLSGKSYGLIHNLYFHPRVENLLLTTQSGLIRFWDQSNSQIVKDIRLDDGLSVLSTDFFAYQPYLLAASCSDRSIRIWDTRVNNDKAIHHTQNVHTSGGKPFTVKCIDKKQKSIIFSVGFSKNGSREFATFDIRKGASIESESDYLQRTTIDQISSVISPFWDEDISVMYLAGKGDANIRYYEFVPESNQFDYLTEFAPDTGESAASRPQKSVDMLPKTMCDVNKFEMARFVKLTNDNIVKVISFKVSRHKNIAQYFHEDIFPDTWNRQPLSNVSVDDWKNAKLSERLKKSEIGIQSLKPVNKTSIFDVPVSEGGKERPESEDDEEFEDALAEPTATPSVEDIPQYELTPTKQVGSTLSTSPSNKAPNNSTTSGGMQTTTTTMTTTDYEIEEIVTITIQKSLQSMLVLKIVGAVTAGGLLFYLIGETPFLYYILATVPPLIIYLRFFAHVHSRSESVERKLIEVPKTTIVHVNNRKLSSAADKKDNVLTRNFADQLKIVVAAKTPVKNLASLSTPTTPTAQTPTQFAQKEDASPQLMDLVSHCSVTMKDLKRKAHEEDKSCAAKEIDVVNVRKGKQPLLLYVRGRIIKRASLIPTHYTSMLHLKRCSFVLDMGHQIFQYSFADANKFTKAFALDIAQEIKAKERGGQANVAIYEQGKLPHNEAEKRLQPQFWKQLGCTDENQFFELQAKHLNQIGGHSTRDDDLIQNDDDVYCGHVDKSMHIYRINSELLKYEEEQSSLRAKHKIAETETSEEWIKRIQQHILLEVVWNKAQPSHKILQTDSCYIIESTYPSNEVFFWQGNKSDPNSRAWGLTMGRKIAHYRSQSAHVDGMYQYKKTETSNESFTTFTRIIENGEHVLFKRKFSDFPASTLDQLSTSVKPVVKPKTEEKEIDIAALVNPPKRNIADAHSGLEMFNEQTRMWRIQQFDKVVFEDVGHFYSMDAYITLHTYQRIKNGKPCHTIYFWQGRDIKKAERGTSAYKAVEVNDMISGKDSENTPDGGQVEKQVRVVQTLEPDAFTRLYPSGFIIYKGYYHDRVQRKKEQNIILFNAATVNNVTHLTECDYISSSYLCGYNCSVLVDVANCKIYLWTGRSASEKQITDCSKLITEKLAPHVFADSEGAPTEPQIEKQGSETTEFIKYFTGEFKSVVTTNTSSTSQPKARMFEITEETGVITCTECVVSQENLQSEKNYIIDASSIFGSVFLWVGKLSSVSVKKFAANLAEKYAAYIKVDKSKSYVVEEFYEPMEVRVLFGAWSELCALSKDRWAAVTEKDSALASKFDYFSRLSLAADSCKLVFDQIDSFAQRFYSYELLSSADRSKLPEGIDFTVVENYLSDEDFQRVFAMDRAKWATTPGWKRSALKKKANLF